MTDLPLHEYWVEARPDGDQLVWCPDSLELDNDPYPVDVGEPMEGAHLSDLVDAVRAHQVELDEAVSAEDAYFESLRAMEVGDRD